MADDAAAREEAKRLAVGWLDNAMPNSAPQRRAFIAPGLAALLLKYRARARREALEPLKQAATRMYSAAAVLRDVKDERAGAARKLLIDSAREVDAVLLSIDTIRALAAETGGKKVKDTRSKLKIEADYGVEGW